MVKGKSCRIHDGGIFDSIASSASKTAQYAANSLKIMNLKKKLSQEIEKKISEIEDVKKLKEKEKNLLAEFDKLNKKENLTSVDIDNHYTEIWKEKTADGRKKAKRSKTSAKPKKSKSKSKKSKSKSKRKM